MPKIESKNLIFKTSIAGVKTRLLIDNRNKTEFIDEFFVHINRISIFKLEKTINLALRNDKIVQQLTKKTFININIRNHIEQLIYYLAKLDAYMIIFEDG